jgi:hypothetical protein
VLFALQDPVPEVPSQAALAVEHQSHSTISITASAVFFIPKLLQSKGWD